MQSCHVADTMCKATVLFRQYGQSVVKQRPYSIGGFSMALVELYRPECVSLPVNRWSIYLDRPISPFQVSKRHRGGLDALHSRPEK